MTGDGFGKPLGILNSQAGIPICETSDATPPGMFTWQDLVMLRFQIPQNFADGGSYVMNAHTLGLLMTMSDANGRPIMTSTPGDAVPFRIGGAPVVIATQMPDVAPGSMPIAYRKQAYMVVNRRGVTVQNAPFSPAGVIYSNSMRASAAASCVRTRRGCCAFARALPSRGDDGTIFRAHTTLHAPWRTPPGRRPDSVFRRPSIAR